MPSRLDRPATSRSLPLTDYITHEDEYPTMLQQTTLHILFGCFAMINGILYYMKTQPHHLCLQYLLSYSNNWWWKHMQMPFQDISLLEKCIASWLYSTIVRECILMFITISAVVLHMHILVEEPTDINPHINHFQWVCLLKEYVLITWNFPKLVKKICMSWL